MYCFFRGEDGDNVAAGAESNGGNSTRDEAEDALDLVRARVFHDSIACNVGDGNGVISSIAAIIGDDMTDPGETDPAVECNQDLTLGIRCVRLAAEALDTILGSSSPDPTEDCLLKF